MSEFSDYGLTGTTGNDFLFEEAPIGIYFYDTNGIVLKCNKKFCEIIGADQSKVIGLNIFNYLDDHDIIEGISKSLTTGYALVEKVYTSRAANKSTPVVAEFKAIRDSSGNITGGIAFINDVTRRYELSDKYSSSEESFRGVLNNLPMFGLVLSSSGEILESNAYFNNYFSGSKGSVEGLDFFRSFLRENDQDKARKYFYAGNNFRKKYSDNIFELIKNEEDFRIVSWTITPKTDNSGKPGNIVCIGEDVTERIKHTFEKLENERRLKHALSGSGQGVWEVDFVEKKLYLDETFLDMLELPAFLTEQSLYDITGLVHKDDVPRLLDLFREFRAGRKEVFNIEIRIFRAKEKSYRWALLTGSLMESDDKDRATRVIGTQIDIDSKKLEGKYLEVERDYSLKLNQKLSINQLLQISLEYILKLADISSGGIYLSNSDGSITLKYHTGFGENFVNFVKHYPAGAPQIEMIKKGNPVFVDYPPDNGDVPEIYHRENITGAMIFPLIKDGVAYGAINLGFKSSKKFELANRKRIENFAYIITNAISRAITEENLAKSEAKYRNFIGQTTDAIICIEYENAIQVSRDIEEQVKLLCGGVIVDVNEAFVAIFELGRRYEVLGTRADEVFKDGIAHCKELFYEFVIRNYKLDDYEYSFHSASGVVKHVIVNFNSFARNDSISQVWITFKDITRIKNVELALQESETKYSSVVENASEIILMHVDGIIKFVNRAALKHTGFNNAEIIGSNILDFVYPEDQKIVLQNLAGRKPEQPEINPYKVRLVKKGGGWFYGEIIGRIIDYDNEPAYLIFIQDVTTKIESERKLRESEENYRLLAETTSDGIAKVDRAGNLTFANRASGDISGYNVKDLLTRKIHELLPEDQIDSNKRVMSVVFAGSSFDGEGSILKKSGEVIPVSISMAPIRRSDGNVDEAVIIFRDITKRKNYEEELKEKEARLRTLLSQIPAIVWTTNKSGILTSVAGSALGTVGVKPEDIIGKPFAAVLGMFVDPNYHSRYENDIKSGKAHTLEIDVKNRTFEIAAEPLKHNDGYIIGGVGIALDVTERRKTEEKIKQLSIAVEQSATSIVITDLNGTIEYVNNKCMEVTGYSREELIAQNPRVLKSGEVSPEDYAEMWQKIKNGEEWSGEFHNRRKNGELFWERAVISPIKNNLGELTHFLAVKEDITQIKKVQEELENYKNRLEELVSQRTSQLKVSQERFRKLAEYSKDIIIRFTNSGEIIYFNPALSNFIPGLDNEKTYGINNLTKSRKLLSELPVVIAEVFSQKKQIVKELNFPGDFWFEWSFIPEFDEEGNVKNVIAFAHDITERMKVEEKMRKALATEKELNKLKSNFISMASHEFRTPLTAILASADLLEMFGRKWDDTKYEEHISKIQRGVDEMTVLLDEVLTLSRYESGKTFFNPDRANIFSFIEETVESVKLSDFFSHRLSTNFDLSEKEQKFDPRLLTQVLTNLLTNAMKYSDKGSNIYLNLEESEDYLILKISDEGLGIPFEEQKHIFDPFYRGTDVQEIAGSGLGLSIVSESVKLHHGFIKFTSLPGKGTEFIIYLPKLYE